MQKRAKSIKIRVSEVELAAIAESLKQSVSWQSGLINRLNELETLFERSLRK